MHMHIREISKPVQTWESYIRWDRVIAEGITPPKLKAVGWEMVVVGSLMSQLGDLDNDGYHYVFTDWASGVHSLSSGNNVYPTSVSVVVGKPELMKVFRKRPKLVWELYNQTRRSSQWERSGELFTYAILSTSESSDGKTLIPENIWTNEDMRRKGLATAMWDYVKCNIESRKTGSFFKFKLKHSSRLTDSGAGWAKAQRKAGR